MKIKLYNVDGWHWLGVEHNGQLFLICRKGRIGDCIRL